MSITFPTPDVDEFPLVDEPTCDVAGCGDLAAWWLVCLACNKHGTLCVVCEAALADDFHEVDLLGARVRCAECDAHVPAAEWRMLWTVKPLGCAA